MAGLQRRSSVAPSEQTEYARRYRARALPSGNAATDPEALSLTARVAGQADPLAPLAGHSPIGIGTILLEA